MSDNYRGIDNDGAYRSRRSASSPQDRREEPSGARRRSGSYTQSSAPKTNPPSDRQRGEHRSAVGRYTGSGASAGTESRKTAGGDRKFRVNISEDDYYDGEIAKKEINAARNSTPPVRRRQTTAATRTPARTNANPAVATRIVTGSMGDTYQIQEDGVMAPRQLRSRQKSVRKRNRGCLIALVYSAAVCSISILLSYYLIVGVNDMFALVKDSTDIVIDVPKGATLDDITDLLDENDVVEYPFFFKTYAKFSKKSTGFKAGRSTPVRITTSFSRSSGDPQARIRVPLP